MNRNCFLSKYKTWILAAAMVWGILLVLFLARLGWIIHLSYHHAKLIQHSACENKRLLRESGDSKAWEIQKEISWLEQQLVLAKSDSMSLGINLRDSLLQVQLKGTVLLQAKILYQKPSNFLEEINPLVYLRFFNTSKTIYTEGANLPKKPIKKVLVSNVAVNSGDATTKKVADPRLFWEFYFSNNIKVVVNGVTLNLDSIPAVSVQKDVIKTNLADLLQQPKTPNSPTLYLWLNDKEAKAIYRALPEKARVIFLN